MNILKRIVFLAALAVLTFSLCSCSSYGTELSQSMIIQGIGVDRASDGRLSVTVEILNNLQSGAVSAESASRKKSLVFTAYAETVSEAVRNIADFCGKQPLYAHNRVIVIGEGAAKNGVADMLDFFERDYGTKPSGLLCMARGLSAQSIFNADTGSDSVKSEVLESILTEGTFNSRIMPTRVLDAVNSVISDELSLTLPAISIEKADEKTFFALDGCAVFDKDDNFAFYLDKAQSRGLVFLNGRAQKGSIETSVPTGSASLLIVKSKSRYKTEIKNGVPELTLFVDIKADLNELRGVSFKALDPKLLSEVRRAAENTVKDEITACFNALKACAGGCDAAKFSRRVELYDYPYFKALKAAGKTVAGECKLYVNVSITVHRTGDESFS